MVSDKILETRTPYSEEATLIAALMADLGITEYVVPVSFEEPKGMIIDVNPLGKPTVKIV